MNDVHRFTKSDQLVVALGPSYGTPSARSNRYGSPRGVERRLPIPLRHLCQHSWCLIYVCVV